MKAILTILLILSSVFSFGQKLKFKITGQKDTTVNLVRYFGKGLYYADTAEMKNGIVQFDGSKQKTGILALFLPEQKMLEFIYNEEDVYIEASLPDLMGTAKVKKSEENKIFNKYVQFVNAERTKATKLVEQRKAFDPDAPEFKEITAKIESTTKGVIAYQQNIVDNHWDKLVSRVIKMSMDVVIPDSPKDENGIITDSSFKFRYFRDHYFDNIDLKDDRLVRTPIYHKKLEKYFSKQMMVQHWDTIIHYAFNLCDKMEPSSEMYRYNVSWITSNYEKSKIMGMDKVFVRMGERYYCGKDGEKPKAYWLSDEKLDKLCTKINTNKNLVMGVKPPNISLRDTTDINWRNFYDLDADFTILYFWDPNCGHCKKITPKLQTLYEKKFKARNVEIFAIGKAIGDDFEKWKKFVRENKLDFINVAVTDELYNAAMKDARQFVPKFTTLESLNYQKTYDVYSTPKVYVLDKDKKIIGKSLSVSQLEDLIDRVQNKKDSAKIFPPNKDNPEEEQMH